MSLHSVAERDAYQERTALGTRRGTGEVGLIAITRDLDIHDRPMRPNRPPG